MDVAGRVVGPQTPQTALPVTHRDRRVPRTITVPVRKTYGTTFWFRLYAVYDVAQGRKYLPIERRDFVREFSIPTVPLVHEALVLDGPGLQEHHQRRLFQGDLEQVPAEREGLPMTKPSRGDHSVLGQAISRL